MIGLLLLAGGGGRLGSCGLEAQECSGSRKRLQEGEEGEGEGGTRGGGHKHSGSGPGAWLGEVGARECGIMAFKNQDFGLGRKHKRGRSGQGRDFALGRKLKRLGSGPGVWLGGKPLEALFPPAVKGRSQKMVIL